MLGVGALVYSLLTDYELGVARVINMKMHLGTGYFIRALLALSPWLFRFSDVVYMPHLILGLVEIGAGLLTRNVPGTRRLKTSATT